MIDITYAALKANMLRKSYAWFSGIYDLNVVGIRNPENNRDDFNDTFCIAYMDVNGYNRIFLAPCTTDPGHYYLQNPLTAAGTAILKEGQHRGSHVIGIHKGYTALVQKKALPVYRDNNNDKVLNMERTQTGMYGINIHRAIENSLAKTIGKFSAGCTVIQSPDDFQYILNLVRRQKQSIGSDTISYTIMTEKDIS